MWSIAEDAYGSGYNWTDIYSANKLSSDKLEAGQKIEIPNVTAKLLTAEATPVATVKPELTPTPTSTLVPSTPAPTKEATVNNDTSYTVVRGDSLWNIAVKEYGNGYKWVEIARANKLKNPNIIHAGNVLTLPR